MFYFLFQSTILISIQLHSVDLSFGASPTGSYGIGITLDKVGHGLNMGLPIIKEVLPNGSAFAKLACGDMVVSVNGILLDKSKPLKSTMQMIKGAEETFVDITVLRFHPVLSNDETLTFRLKRRPLQNLSPVIKRAPILPTTFTSSPRSFAGVRVSCQHLIMLNIVSEIPPSQVALQVNLLTPRIDYPPEPIVERPQSHERMQQLAQHHIPRRQHLSPPASSTSQVIDGSGNQPQSNLQIQNSKNLLAMNLMKLPPHQHQELLKLQMQLNHLQQLSHQQQMKTQLLEHESKLLSPDSLSLKVGARLFDVTVSTLQRIFFVHIGLITLLQFPPHTAPALAFAPTSSYCARTRRFRHNYIMRWRRF